MCCGDKNENNLQKSQKINLILTTSVVSYKCKSEEQYMKKYLKSPFILATVSGLGALVADTFWLLGELSVNFGLMSEHMYICYKFFILAALIIAIVVCFVSIRHYVSNSYMRSEEHSLKCYKTHKKAVKAHKEHMKRIHHESIE